MSNLLSLRLVVLDKARVTGKSSCLDFLSGLRDKCNLLRHLDTVSRVDTVDIVPVPDRRVPRRFLHVHDLVVLLRYLRWLVKFGLR